MNDFIIWKEPNLGPDVCKAILNVQVNSLTSHSNALFQAIGQNFILSAFDFVNRVRYHNNPTPLMYIYNCNCF